MMWANNLFIYGFIYLFLEFCTCYNTINELTTDSYLNMQAQYAKRELNSPNVINQRSQQKDFEIYAIFNNSKTVSLLHNYTTAETFWLHNQLYVNFGPEIYQISSNSQTVKINRSLSFDNVEVSNLFIRVVEFNDVAVLLVPFSTGVSKIYSSTNHAVKWKLIQLIQSEKIISNAMFFKDDGNLYLCIISSNEFDSLSFISIYKWSGTYFDQISKLQTKNPTNVINFQSKGFQYIIFLDVNLLETKIQHQLVIYQLNKDRLKKYQELKAVKGDRLVTYEYNSIQYVALFSETNSSLYWWDSSELILLSNFGSYKHIKKILVSRINATLLLFVVQENNLLIFAHSNNQIRLISKSTAFELYKSVLEIKVVAYNNSSHVLLAFLQSCDNKLSYITIPFILTFKELVHQPHISEQLLQCLKTLETKTTFIKNKLDNIFKQSTFRKKRSSSKIIYKKSVSETDTINNLENFSKNKLLPNKNGISMIASKIETIRTRIEKLDSEMDLLITKGKSINGKTTIIGKLYAEELVAENLKINYLNKTQWLPHTWLSYTQPQTITGRVYINNLNATNIKVSEKNTLNDVLFNEDNQDIDGNFIFERLTCTKLNVEKVNDIAFKDIYLKSKGGIIEGVKKLTNPHADEIMYDKGTSTEYLQLFFNNNSKNIKFSKDLSVENIYVENINTIDWKEFQDNVFRIGIDNKITGNLEFSNFIKINHLFTENIQNIEASTLFTTTTDQVVSSNLKFENVMANNVTCSKLNNVSLSEIVTSKNPFVKGPVTIDNLQIENNLHINDSVDTSKTDEITGTKEMDLLQIYNKKVTIRGNLYLSNLGIAKGGKVIVDNKLFKVDDVQSYWLKNFSQVIPVHLKPKKGISTSHLNLISLNNIGFDNYLTTSLDDKIPTNVVFENITIVGNVFLNKSVPHYPNLQQLDSEAVKTSGSFSIIGQKTLQGILIVSNLTTNYLDNVDMSNVLTAQSDVSLTGLKQFDTLIVNGNLVSRNITTSFLNSVQLESFQKDLLFLDIPEHISTLSFKNISVENLEIVTINNVELLLYVKYLEHVYQMNSINNLVVNGNVSFANAQNVNTVNNCSTNDLLNKAINRKHQSSIKNVVRFLGNVNAINIEVRNINNINFSNLVSKLFYRSWTQNVTVPFTFDKMITPNIIVPQINNVPTKKVINTKETKPQTLLAWGGLKLTYPKFIKSFTAEKLMCNINEAVKILKNPPTRYWNFLRVSQNATFWDRSGDLSNIFGNVVNLVKNNVITGKVNVSNSILTNSVVTNSVINGLDINEMLTDAVVKNSEEKVIIDGFKTFTKLVVSNAIVDLNADIPTVNNIDIETLNQSIIYKDTINNVLVKGKKTFYSGLQTNHLVTSTLSNISTSDIVNLDKLKVVPETYFQYLEVTNNLTMEFINNISFPDVIQERLMCCTDEEQILEGIYYFDTAVLVGNTTIPFINKVPIDDVVFNDGKDYVIVSPKTFADNITLNGNVKVDLLNNENLSERYKQSINLDEKNFVKGDVILNDVTLVTKDIEAAYLNGISVEHLRELLNSKIPETKIKSVYSIMNTISHNIKVCFNLSLNMPKKFLYLERYTDLQISIPNAISAQVLQVKDNVVLHITQKQKGSYCGLPNGCLCSTQSNLQISEHGSINTIAETGVNRVFSFENQNMSSHLFTSSVSYSDACCSNTESVKNESTSLMWMMYSSNRSHSASYFVELLTGYVSGVEYFTSNGNTYMVISRFFDPQNISTSLDCRVYKFIKNENRVTLIQTINTRNAWTIYVFTTAQGVVLVIGSINTPGKSGLDSGAGVYRFNATTENFVPLRKIFNTIFSATGVVVQAGSLIVLAENTAVQILKYHPNYDNYYHYQHIYFESGVTGISTFYAGDIGISDVYLCIVTENGSFYIYSYQYIQGWILESMGEIDALRLFVPFILNSKHYIFAVSTKQTFLLSAIVLGAR